MAEKLTKKFNRILIITHTYSDIESGGEPKIVFELSHALARAGKKIYVVAPRVNISKPIDQPRLKVYRVPFCRQISMSTRMNMLLVFIFCLPLIFIKRIELIHVLPEPCPCPFVFFKFRPLVFSSDVPWDYENPYYGQDLIYDRFKKDEEMQQERNLPFWQRIIDRLSNYFYIIFNLRDDYPKKIDLYTCTSRGLIEKLESQNYKSKLALVPWGVNLEKFNQRFKPFQSKDGSNLIFMFAGKISKRKGVEYLIKAFKKLSEKHKKIELLIVGGGASSTVEMFKEMASGFNIKFLGNMIAGEMPHYLNYADVFILPSLGEPFGLANVEAMACGKPVISTRAGGVPEYFKDGEVGFLVNPADVDDLESAMEKFVLKPGLIDEMGRKAKEHVANNFTWDISAQKLIQAYNQL